MNIIIEYRVCNVQESSSAAAFCSPNDTRLQTTATSKLFDFISNTRPTLHIAGERMYEDCEVHDTVSDFQRFLDSAAIELDVGMIQSSTSD